VGNGRTFLDDFTQRQKSFIRVRSQGFNSSTSATGKSNQGERFSLLELPRSHIVPWWEGGIVLPPNTFHVVMMHDA
jgi:hypothetical protein